MKRLTFFLAFLFCQIAYSQSLSVFSLDTSGFPALKAKFFAFDAAGDQITNLSISDFQVIENSGQRAVTYVSCPPPQPPQALSSVLTIDVSGSMGGSNLILAKEAAKAWLEGLALGKSECAVTSFDHNNYLNQDFTINRNSLLNAVNSLQALGGTDYDAALLDPPAGSMQITKHGKNKKVVVFLSDGVPNKEPLTSKIISEAISQNVFVYSVILGMNCPQSMRDISEQTGGLWFENVTTVEQARNIYQQILHTAQGGDPCTIEWLSGISCKQGQIDVEIKFLPNNTSSKFSYQTPSNSFAKLEFTPTAVNFLNVEPGVKKDTIIKLTARNADFNISSISCSNAAYVINPTSFSLKAGQNLDLMITYISPDSGYTYTRFDFENNVCKTYYFASGGFPGKKPKIRTLKLIFPNGGESFVVGSDTVITWEGVSPKDKVTLEYSTNNGKKWIEICDNASGLSYNWRIPKTPSEQCLARVLAESIYGDCSDVIIGDQIWMGCNLDVDHYRNSDLIRHAETDADWVDAGNKKEGAWCYYNNNPGIGEIYGKLYNWYAVNDPRGLAPEGWHIPSDDDWKEFEFSLGMPKADLDKFINRGTIEGGKLKSIGTIENGDGLWFGPNEGATNEINFNAVPCGERLTSGICYSIGRYCLFWTSTDRNSSDAYIRALYYDSSRISRGVASKIGGFSVRCIRDK